MGLEINIDSITALDKRIKEITAELAQLKRTRNSLLNVARIPPEILGHIFHLNVMPGAVEGYFPKLRKGSYNFLLVCHHWFRVARNTPELWTFWGNNLEDWRRRYPLSGVSAPVDLVLDGFQYSDEYLDEILRDVLRDRAARDVIRKVHITSPYMDHSAAIAIVSSLTPEDEGIRHSSIESIALGDADVSDFFARHHFPKLRDLYLFDDCKISCWDHLKSHTMALVNLTLTFDRPLPPSAIPTPSQVLSLLTSNPNIRSLALQLPTISDKPTNDATSPVPLRHLERLSLAGNFHQIFSILRQLELPERIDDAVLEFRDCKLVETHENIWPYIRDYLRRDSRFKDRLGVFIRSSANWFSLEVGVGHHGPGKMQPRNPPLVVFEVQISEGLSVEEQEELFIDIIALIPQESVVCLEANLAVAGAEHVLTKMPNIEYLHLVDIKMREGFQLSDPGKTNPHQEFLPSLRWLYLEDVQAEDGDWGLLITYLTHRASGDQAVSLRVFGEEVHICSDVLDQLCGLVGEIFYDPDPDMECPFSRCPMWL